MMVITLCYLTKKLGEVGQEKVVVEMLGESRLKSQGGMCGTQKSFDCSVGKSCWGKALKAVFDCKNNDSSTVQSSIAIPNH
jgi:hypothetical protein